MALNACRAVAAALLLASSALSVAAETAAPFAFVERGNVATGTLITSEAITVQGFTGRLPVSIAAGGDEAPQLRIGNGAFSNGPGEIAAGETLTVRHRSAGALQSARSSTVTVGSTQVQFRSVTGTADRTPDAFDFGVKAYAEPGAWAESAAITPTGFNAPLTVTPSSNAEARIGNGAWSATPGNLAPGQTLAIRHRASLRKLEYTRSSLRLGSGVSGSYTSRTQGQIADTPPPPAPPNLYVADVTVAESARSFAFTVALSASSTQPVTVDFASSDGSAKATQDYLAKTGSLVFAPGETSKIVELTLARDTVDEPDEDLRLLLANVSGAVLTDGEGRALITDDDAPAVASVGAPAACTATPGLPATTGWARYVDPRIGSLAPGFTNPGPVAPWGMVAAGPDTEGPVNYGGYSAQNTLITGFSHVHMTAGVYKGGQFPVLPFTGERATGDLSDAGWTNPVPAYSSSFDRATEVAEAGYYRVLLTKYPVAAELTATPRTALHRYTFCDGGNAAPRLILDVSRALGGYEAASVTRRADGTLTGRVRTGDAGGHDLYFAARLDTPYTAQTFTGTALAAGQTATGDKLGLILDLPALTASKRPLLLKLALSYTDEAGALANLEAESPDWDFDTSRQTARADWEKALAAITVEGGTDNERKSFYTALYRLQHFPNLHSDVDGRYRGPDRTVHAADGFEHYSQFSSWDSYRGQNAMQAELFPARYRDMVRSLLAFHEQAGFLPRWQQGPGDASHMSGDPIIPFIGEAWCRNLLDASLKDRLWPAMQTLVSRRPAELAQRGYLTVAKPANQAELLEGGPARAGTTLEYGIADFSLALMAQGRSSEEASALAQRSLNYRNLLDPETKWIRPRHDDGSWLVGFAPELGYGFQEGTSWQYSWLAQHDYAGLFARMGGDAAVNDRLDQFFSFPAAQAPLAVPAIQNQITLFGIAYYGNQYAPGNEHDLQAPYAYHYLGAPWKSAAVARAAASIYTPTVNGLPGNDDLGALSGWLLWNMIGLYPVNPGSPLLLAGSPHFDKVTLKRPVGDLVVESPGASAAMRFVTGLSLDAQQSSKSWLIAPQKAASLRLNVAAVPDMAWGMAAGDRPPSLTGASLARFGCTP